MSADITPPYRPGKVLIAGLDLKQIGPVEDASSKISLPADVPFFNGSIDEKNAESQQ
jgi:hypothetical protein